MEKFKKEIFKLAQKELKKPEYLGFHITQIYPWDRDNLRVVCSKKGEWSKVLFYHNKKLTVPNIKI